ncbi:protein of unknown function (DUF4129) [Abditibacterium utsteinense]|uniref:Transglutaminase-like domain-containing protein n=1 Tax=Abditibacterium utsteinense TaxID=1960156 RepID=A0A2S8SXD2_9BACT|nr:transglutaminaseTgpA domain-containing protein [Abditibacterium utsteinense]PQV65460.1 protein of unknown function (DUF4129) [Abditibacterium utsteinense]
MLIAPPIHLTTRLRSESSPWELALRYIAATAATLLAIAGAQLVVENSFIWILAGLTLVGVPVSVFLRLNDMKVGPIRISRPLWNSLTVMVTFGTASNVVFWSLRDFLVPVFTGQVPPAFWANFGASEPVELLMKVFLLFAAFRSFAIISDKDATLTTVPSFSVLLLLIPLHQNIEVVIYFVAWIFVAATLFALDHRSEVRVGVQATVPAIVPGQDVRLGARSLLTVLAISLAAAIGISFWLTSRDPKDRSSIETAVTSLATRLTNMVLSKPEMSVNAGPDRQIDFTADLSLPSRTVLWSVTARIYGGKRIRPAYWRLFTLNHYNGNRWSQRRSDATKVQLSDISFKRWPPRVSFERVRAPRYFNFPLNSEFPGYDLQRSNPKIARQFGKPAALVRQTLTAHISSIGFIPVQPSARALVLSGSEQDSVRLRSDGAIDVGVVQAGQMVKVLSDVPALPEYGIACGAVPTKQWGAAQIAASQIALSPSQRLVNLQLPATLPARVRNLGRAMLKNSAPGGSNYARAQRMARAIQNGAVYTLRPPAIPDGREATDFFLFDGDRRGYCTYFAGALTVLCRTQGIPARVVSGFAGTEWEANEQGILREANAHAWTEVWVDGFGWAVVDATPAGERGDNAPAWIENWGDLFASIFHNSWAWARKRVPLISLFVAACAAGILLLKNRKNGVGFRFSRRALDDDFERRAVSEVYRRTARIMARKFRPRSHWETPDEWLQACNSSLSLSDVEELRRLTALHLSARYAERPLPAGSAQFARQIAARIGWNTIKRD